MHSLELVYYMGQWKHWPPLAMPPKMIGSHQIPSNQKSAFSTQITFFSQQYPHAPKQWQAWKTSLLSYPHPPPYPSYPSPPIINPHQKRQQYLPPIPPPSTQPSSSTQPPKETNTCLLNHCLIQTISRLNLFIRIRWQGSTYPINTLDIEGVQQRLGKNLQGPSTIDVDVSQEDIIG